MGNLNPRDDKLLRLYQTRKQLMTKLKTLEKNNRKWINREDKKQLSESYSKLLTALELIKIQISNQVIDDNSLGSIGEVLGYELPSPNSAEQLLLKVTCLLKDINYNDSKKTLMRRVKAKKQTSLDLQTDINEYWSVIIAQEMLLLGERYLHDHSEDQLLRDILIDIKYELANLYPFMENALIANNFEVVHPCIFPFQTLYTAIEGVPFEGTIHQKEMMRQITAATMFSIQRIVWIHLNDCLNLKYKTNPVARPISIVNTLVMEAALNLLPKETIKLNFLSFKTLANSPIYAGCYRDVKDVVMMINDLFTRLINKELPNYSDKEKRFKN